MLPRRASAARPCGRRSVSRACVALALATTAPLLTIAGATAAGAATATTTVAPNPGGPGGPGGGSFVFCGQVTTSQAAIAKVTGDAKAKLKATALEWSKIESTAPATLKAQVTLVRKAYDTAAAAGTSDAVKSAAVTAAGKAITTFVAANCKGGGAGGGRGFGGNDVDLTAYRACLTSKGVTLPAPGSGTRIDRTDPKVQAAMTACQDKLPAGARGGFGGGGFGGGGNFAAIRDCLTKKGITLPAFGGRNGGNGNGGTGTAAAGGTAPAGGGAPPTFDAKTQKALEECRAAAQSATTTTTTKK